MGSEPVRGAPAQPLLPITTHLRALFQQSRKLHLHHIPDNLQVNAKVTVDQLVTHGYDLPPSDSWVGITHLLRITGGRFSDQLDVAKVPVLQELISCKDIQAEISAIADGTGRKCLHIVEIQLPVPLGAPLRR